MLFLENHRILCLKLSYVISKRTLTQSRLKRNFLSNPFHYLQRETQKVSGMRRPRKQNRITLSPGQQLLSSWRHRPSTFASYFWTVTRRLFESWYNFKRHCTPIIWGPSSDTGAEFAWEVRWVFHGRNRVTDWPIFKKFCWLTWEVNCRRQYEGFLSTRICRYLLSKFYTTLPRIVFYFFYLWMWTA